MHTPIQQDTPAVWIGCLACYNDGALVGDWYDAIDADQVTVADLHRGTDRNFSQCEELRCMDTENIPVSGEMSPMDAARWGRALDAVDDHLLPALFAWVRSGDYVAEGDGDLPSISDFAERYCGEWESFEDYAHQLAEDIGLLVSVPEEISRYFHWSSWIGDLAFDYTNHDAPGGGVFVFRSL